MSLLTKTKTNTKTKKISSKSLFEMMIWYQVHSLALCGANIVDNFLFYCQLLTSSLNVLFCISLNVLFSKSFIPYLYNNMVTI